MNDFLANLSERDRRVLLGGGAVAAMLLLWALVWDPLAKSRASLREQAAANETALQWMRPAAEQLAAKGGVAAAVSADGRSLLARVDASARESGLGASLVSVEPEGSGRVNVQFTGADFDALSAWLERIAGTGVGIEELSVQRGAGSGRVDARIGLRGTGA